MNYADMHDRQTGIHYADKHDHSQHTQTLRAYTDMLDKSVMCDMTTQSMLPWCVRHMDAAGTCTVTLGLSDDYAV